MPVIPEHSAELAPHEPSSPSQYDHVFIGSTSTSSAIREIPLNPHELLIHIRFPSLSSPGSRDFEASFHHNGSLQAFILESYAFIENILKPRFRRHPVIKITLNHQDGLAQTAEGIVTISCVWLDSWHRKLQVARKKGDVPGEKEQAVFNKEIRGVVLHELVHLIQFDGYQTAPSWFIESLADYIRLRASLDAANWDPSGSGPEEEGYKQGYGIGARFLHWIEHGKGDRGGDALGAMREINARLEKDKWDDKWIVELAGGSWEHLWKRYKKAHA